MRGTGDSKLQSNAGVGSHTSALGVATRKKTSEIFFFANVCGFPWGSTKADISYLEMLVVSHKLKVL